jgi:hypothetical protein
MTKFMNDNCHQKRADDHQRQYNIYHSNPHIVAFLANAR